MSSGIIPGARIVGADAEFPINDLKRVNAQQTNASQGAHMRGHFRPLGGENSEAVAPLQTVHHYATYPKTLDGLRVAR